LYIFAPDPVNDEIKTISGLMKKVFSQKPDFTDNDTRLVELNSCWNAELNQFDMGSVPVVQKVEPIKPNTIIDYISTPVQNRLRLRLRYNDFFAKLPSEKQEKVNKGNLMHELFQNIITVHDIETAVQKMVFEGKLGIAESEELKQSIMPYFLDTRVAEWFDGSWIVKAENDILIPGGRTIRPDRVLIKATTVLVIDYKFGQRHLSEYNRQVALYAAHLKNMGYTDVKGFLWYVLLNEIEEVIGI
jgi:ATP-dependent exoDNAse (exonuclease V) beta subunit